MLPCSLCCLVICVSDALGEWGTGHITWNDASHWRRLRGLYVTQRTDQGVGGPTGCHGDLAPVLSKAECEVAAGELGLNNGPAQYGVQPWEAVAKAYNASNGTQPQGCYSMRGQLCVNTRGFSADRNGGCLFLPISHRPNHTRSHTRAPLTWAASGCGKSDGGIGLPPQQPDATRRCPCGVTQGTSRLSVIRAWRRPSACGSAGDSES